MTARGDIFTVPAKEGSIRNLTRTPGIRERYAVWSPDGRWVAYVSDRSGEDELYMIPQDGAGSEVRITFDGKMFRLPPVWSPDSTKVAFADKSTRLFYVDVTQKKPVQMTKPSMGRSRTTTGLQTAAGSLTPGRLTTTTIWCICIALADAKSTPVTHNASDSMAPYFDPEGKYLYFFRTVTYNEVSRRL